MLKDINLVIPEGKITAIVGISGSGKTTLLKLLLKIYEEYDGEITIGAVNQNYKNNGNAPAGALDLGDKTGSGERRRNVQPERRLRFENIAPSFWRSQCGAVMQDGYIFNDTIAGNIAVGEESIDFKRLMSSCETANILGFIESLPNGFYTELGSEGVGLSQGQKQRLLIARAVYKNPAYLFFDEATNSLDANNEREIIDNLAKFFENKTVIVVAHRLSTVKNADKIVVLEQGEIVEAGTHDELTRAQGKYFELVRNQLELGL